MNSRPSHNTLQKYYQLPGHNIIEQTNTYSGRDTSPELFLLDRGGNRGFAKDPYEGFQDLKPSSVDLEDKLQEKLEKKKEFKFYHGDQILSQNYFKGWNDSYFFQTALFRKDPKFWVTPFKSDYFQGK